MPPLCFAQARQVCAAAASVEVHGLDAVAESHRATDIVRRPGLGLVQELLRADERVVPAAVPVRVLDAVGAEKAVPAVDSQTHGFAKAFGLNREAAREIAGHRGQDREVEIGARALRRVDLAREPQAALDIVEPRNVVLFHSSGADRVEGVHANLVEAQRGGDLEGLLPKRDRRVQTRP